MENNTKTLEIWYWRGEPPTNEEIGNFRFSRLWKTHSLVDSVQVDKATDVESFCREVFSQRNRDGQNISVFCRLIGNVTHGAMSVGDLVIDRDEEKMHIVLPIGWRVLSSTNALM